MWQERKHFRRQQSKCIFLASKLISEWLRVLSTRAKSNTISAARLPLKYLRFGWEASGAQVRRAVEKIRAKAGAHKTLGKAEEVDDAEQVENFNQRFLVEAQGDQKPPLEECKKLLLLMGKPFVDIKLLPLAKRKLSAPHWSNEGSEARKMPIQEFHLDKVWSGLELIKEQVNFTQCLQTGPSSTRGNFSWNPKSQLSWSGEPQT
ncbi:Hypothetical predicted protein [Cloeon dipterum]|uniref:Uncharacterized protein n=1 Tax=Cloeon dipterum TaxID=197152 RepID=A0A8S1E1Q8_9INSE|nr:Hypothetical predicted protein [Cloeon dipterum]